MVGVPHPSVAVALPASGIEVGLQPRSLPAGQNVNTGPVASATHVNVWPMVAVLPQASVALKVRVCDRLHELEVTSPSEEVTVGVPQLSLADGFTGVGSPVGLHPRSEPVGVEVNPGACASVTVISFTQREISSPFLRIIYTREKLHAQLELVDTDADPTVSLVRLMVPQFVAPIICQSKLTPCDKSEAATPLLNVLVTLHSKAVGPVRLHIGGSCTAAADSERSWFPIEV
jgi:hypothetical protein